MTDASANMSPSERGWKAALLIALLGPPIGGLIVAIQISADQIINGTKPAIGTLPALMLFSYMYIGIPAIVVALYAGIRIGTRGWLSLLEFLMLSVFLSVAPFAQWGGMFPVGAQWREALQGLISLSNLILLPHTLLTAFILRYLLLRWGIMKRPSNPKTAANAEA